MRPRLTHTIDARARLRWEPWRMYGPAVGGWQRFTKQDRVYLWTRLNDFARRLGTLRPTEVDMRKIVT